MRGAYSLSHSEVENEDEPFIILHLKNGDPLSVQHNLKSSSACSTSSIWKTLGWTAFGDGECSFSLVNELMEHMAQLVRICWYRWSDQLEVKVFFFDIPYDEILQ